MKHTPTQITPTPRAVPMPAPQPMAAPQPMPVQQQPMAAPRPAPIMQPAPAMAPLPASTVPSQAVPPMPPMAAAPAPAQAITSAYDMALAEEEIPHEGGDKALPQIAIHAFCDRQETAGVINQTTRDWRMKRTNVKIYMGGLPAAIEYYHKENTPSLILIESGMRGSELFNQLEQLASVCDAGTKVVVIGAANDIRLYRQLMEKGVSDYIVPPFHPLMLIRSLGDLYTDPDKPFIGRVAAFFGSKGGVGSSTIAHNIAWCLSEVVQQETALVDLDSSWGTTGLDFAYDATQGLEEALAEPDRLDETLLDRIMIRHTPKLSILPTAASLQNKSVVDVDAYEAVVNGVRSISPMTILDMPHHWSDWTTNVLTNVDDVVITATPDLANLRNTKNLIDFLKAARPNDAEPILILNKTGLTKNEISVKEFSAAVGLEPALVLGFDPDSYYEALNEGKMLTDVKSASGTVNGFNYIAYRLKSGNFDSMPLSAPGKSGSLLGKLKKGGKPEAEKKAGKSLFSLKKNKKA